MTGTAPYIAKWRPRYSALPSPPRCKVCDAPFAGPGRFITRLTGHHVIPGNPLLCNRCLDSLAKHPGGAEVDVSVLFADIRGSTGLAEKVGAARFRQLLQSYYAKASAAIEASDGIVDKLLGDGVMALFIPVIAGENHRLRAIEAGRRVIRAVEESDLPRQGVRVGAGVQSGTTFVGVLGSGEKLDFSALGDVVNTAARSRRRWLVQASCWSPPMRLACGRASWSRRLESRQLPHARGDAEDTMGTTSRCSGVRPHPPYDRVVTILNDEQAALRDAVRELARDKIAPRAAAIDATGEFPWDMVELLAGQDILALPYPAEYGGLGGDMISVLVAIEELSHADATTGLILAVQELSALPLDPRRHGRAEAALAARPGQRQEARRLRADRGGRRLGRGEPAHARPSATARTGSSTARSASSARATSPAWWPSSR